MALTSFFAGWIVPAIIIAVNTETARFLANFCKDLCRVCPGPVGNEQWQRLNRPERHRCKPGIQNRFVKD